MATPASFAQRSMWAAAQRGRGAPLNVFLLRWRLHGELRRDALIQAIGDLSVRHPILRSRLILERGRLMQRIDDSADVPVQVVEAPNAEPQAAFEAAIRLLQQIGRAGLDLSVGPLFKVVLIKLSAMDHLLCFVAHHAICDGWSSQILIRDLGAFYAARAVGQTNQLPILSEQYADFAQAQFQTFESGGYAEEIDYWRTELADPPPPIELPALVPRRGARDWQCEYPARMESPELHGAIRELARHSRVSVFSVLLAAFAVLLHQRSAAQDMLVGVSTLNRWSASALLFVGCATNLLPARIRLSGETTFIDVCAQVHATVRRLVHFGRVPLEVLLRETRQPSLAGPLLPIWCQYREAPPVVESAGLSMTPLQIERVSLQCELELDLLGSAPGLRCEFAFRPALFEQALITALMNDYGTIVRSVAQVSDSRVAELARMCVGQGELSTPAGS